MPSSKSGERLKIRRANAKLLDATFLVVDTAIDAAAPTSFKQLYRVSLLLGDGREVELYAKDLAFIHCIEEPVPEAGQTATRKHGPNKNRKYTVMSVANGTVTIRSYFGGGAVKRHHRDFTMPLARFRRYYTTMPF
jgi:hypothetical protein